jgi:hypothetical protein
MLQIKNYLKKFIDNRNFLLLSSTGYRIWYHVLRTGMIKFLPYLTPSVGSDFLQVTVPVSAPPF